MAKQIIFGEKAKEGLKRGIGAVADAVKITLGRKGRNVILEKGYGRADYNQRWSYHRQRN